MPISINLDRLIEAMLDTRTPHYWDPKRSKIIRGGSDLEEEKARRVLIDTIGKRKFKQLTDGFAKTLDPKDAKLVLDAVKGSFDKFNRLIAKRDDLKDSWMRYAADDLLEAAQDWLILQGIEEFIATGDFARIALEEEEEEDEDDEDTDDDDDDEEEAEEADDDEEDDELEDELDEELDEEDEDFEDDDDDENEDEEREDDEE